MVSTLYIPSPPPSQGLGRKDDAMKEAQRLKDVMAPESPDLRQLLTDIEKLAAPAPDRAASAVARQSSDSGPAPMMGPARKKITIAEIDSNDQKSETLAHNSSTAVATRAPQMAGEARAENSAPPPRPPSPLHVQSSQQSIPLSSHSSAVPLCDSSPSSGLSSTASAPSVDITMSSEPGSKVHGSSTPSPTIPGATSRGVLPVAVREKQEQGDAASSCGQYADASAYYTAALEGLGDDVGWATARANLLSARALSSLKAGDCQGCVRDCTEALSVDPSNTSVNLQRAMGYEALELFTRACDDYQAALRANSSPSIPLVGLNRCKKMATMLGGKTYDGSGWAQREFDAVKAVGNDLVKLGLYGRAMLCYTRCLTLCPGDAAAHNNRSLCFLRLSRFEEARDDASAVLVKDKDNVKALFRRGVALSTLGQPVLALSNFEAVLLLDKDNKDAAQQAAFLRQQIADARKIGKEQGTLPEGRITGEKDRAAGKVVRRRVIIEETSEQAEGDNGGSSTATAATLKVDENKMEVKGKAERKKVKIEGMGSGVTDTVNATTVLLPSTSMLSPPSSIPSATSTAPHSTPSASMAIPTSTSSSSSAAPTPAEFMRILSETKGDAAAAALLLRRVSPDQLKRMFSTQLEASHVAVISKAALEFFDPDDAACYLWELSLVSRFPMVAMCMDDIDTIAIKSTINICKGKCKSRQAEERLSAFSDKL